MTTSSYQAFPINKFSTGVYRYLEPWIRAEDAFDPMINSFVYRGGVYKRNGFTPYGLTGYLAYRDSITLATGNGVTLAFGPTQLTDAGTGLIPITNILAGSITGKTITAGGNAVISDNGAGVLTITGGGGGSGTINYTTGIITLTFNTAPSNTQPIIVSFTYYPQNLAFANWFNRPIMGLKQFIDETTNTKTLVACDTRRASKFNASSKLFEPLSSVSYIMWVGNNSSLTFSTLTGFTNIVPYSVSITDGTSTITDNGKGALSAAGNFAAGGTINYATGSVAIVITAASSANFTITFQVAGDYFTGNNTQFFNSTNWKPTDVATGYLYLTNNKDRITTFDGTNLSRLNYSITLAAYNSVSTGVPGNDITTALDVKVYKNRLLFLRPTTRSPSVIGAQSIRYSALFNPRNFAADVPGNGGELSAPTGDWLQCAQFLRDNLIVFFENSTWTFRFTGNSFDPYRFDKINSFKSTNAPYGSVGFDERAISMGALGLIACDGVNVARYDIEVIDLYQDINQDYFGQCFSQRYDNLNQTWMLYPSNSNTTNKSDRALVYNYLENTWAQFDIDMSCLGIHQMFEDAVWNDFAPGGYWYEDFPDWDSTGDEDTWTSFKFQSLAPVLLGGSHYGIVYQMDTGINDRNQNVTVQNSFNDTMAISTTIDTKQWNPFVQLGKLCQFGYIDFYYQTNTRTTLNLKFYANQTSLAFETTLTLDSTYDNPTFSWKRVYLNIVGEFLQMQITNNQSSDFKIVGMILWAKEAGRLTP